jgi:hypothetical protein
MIDMSNLIGASKSPAPRQNEMIEPWGRFTVHFSATNIRGRGREDSKIVWHDKKREKMTFKVADLFSFAIRRFSYSHGYTDEFKVTGYRTLKVNNTSSEKTATYYATEYLNGEKRYDYAMIDFVSDDGLSVTCPARILRFLQYNITLGIPTPHFSDEEGQSLHTIQDNMAVDKIFMWWYTWYLIMYQLNSFNMNLCHPLHLGVF